MGEVADYLMRAADYKDNAAKKGCFAGCDDFGR